MVLATTFTKPQINDIVFHGYLLSIVEGDAEKRVLIGFGSGESELIVGAKGFQMTARGLRKLGSGKFNGVHEKVQDMLKVMDKWGGPETYPHMTAGWAVAFDTPYQWTKQVASDRYFLTLLGQA